jgi:hypothetical protein
MSRFERGLMRRFRTRFARKRTQRQMANTEEHVYDARTPPEVTSPRAKSKQHGKVTADKWNQ